MFTKTGLRPREPLSKQMAIRREGIGKKLPPLEAPYVTSPSALSTARMLRSRQAVSAGRGSRSGRSGSGVYRREETRPRQVSRVSCRGEGGAGRVMTMTYQQEGVSRGGNKTRDLGASTRSARSRGVEYNPRGNSNGRSRSAGRGATGNTTTVRRHRKRPQWDDSLGDPSQYKLTPEEAAQRKKSLVSKHNTLVFGLGDGGGRRGVVAATATIPKETAMVVAARPRSASAQRVEQARKVYGGGGQPRHGRRSRSSSSVSEAARRRGSGKTENVTTLPVADVTVTVENDPEVGGVNDVTTASGDAECGGRNLATGRPWDTVVDGGEACREEGEGKNVAGGDALGLAGIEVGIKAFSERVWKLETYRRAGVEAGHGEDGNAGEEQRQKKCNDQERTGAEKGEACEEGGDGVKEDSSLSRGVTNDNTRVDIASGDLCDGVGGSIFNDSGYHYAAEHLQEQSAPCQETLSNPWDNNHGELVGQKLGTRQQCKSDDDAGHLSARGNEEAVDLVERIQLLEAQVLQLHRHYDRVAAGLVDVGQERTGRGGAGDVGAGEEGQAAGARGGTGDPRAGRARSAEDTMRVMVAGLLSLTGRLIKRATAAEQRLRDLTTIDVYPSGCGGGRGVGGGGANNMYKNDASGEEKHPDVEEGDLSLLRDRARSIGLVVGKVPTCKGEEEEEEEEEAAPLTPVNIRAYSGPINDQGLIAPVAEQQDRYSRRSPSSPLAKLRWQGGSQSRRTVTPPVQQQLRTTSSPSPTKDFWGEALDAVSDLVASRPVCDGTTTTAPAPPDVSSLPSPSPTPLRRGWPISKMDGVGPILAATDMPSLSTTTVVDRGRQYSDSAAAAPSPFRVFGSPSAASPLGQPLRPASLRLPSRVADVASIGSRRSGARVPLTPLRTMAVISRDDHATNVGNTSDNVNYTEVSSVSSRAVAGKEREGGDGLAVPAFWEPTPVKKPQHPFEKSPAMRSPRWLMRHQHRVVIDKGEGSSVVICGSGGGVGDGGSKRRAPFAADTRVYTVVGTNEAAGGARGGVDGNVVNSPPIGQWYTPSV